MYESRRSQRVKLNESRTREPSKDKPDINSSSGAIVDLKKVKIFEKVFNTISTDSDNVKSQFVDPATANFRNLPLAVLDILMEVFTELEEEMRPWNQEKFISKC